MADSLQIVAFSGGDLKTYGAESDAHEAVLALSLKRLIVKVLRVPNENVEDIPGYLGPILQAMSPYPDEPLTIGWEKLRETEQGFVVMAAALPESATDDIATVLDSAKLKITRVDALALGAFRQLLPQIGAEPDRRRLVLMAEEDSIALMVIDGAQPVAARALNEKSNLRREVMLSLLEAEEFGGAKALHEIVAVGQIDAGELSVFAPVRALEVADYLDCAMKGVAERSAEALSLNALPASWGEMLAEARFKSKLIARVGLAAGIWVLVMSVLFGTPAFFNYLADRQKQLCTRHASAYNQVKTLKDKVDMVRKYSDHAHGALEILKAVSDRAPQGIELSNWNFKRDESDVNLSLSGEADMDGQIYQFKDAISKMGVFADVEMSGVSSGKSGRKKFSITCSSKAKEEQ